ncbi:MAG: hypothetical protein JWP14_922 [Frankiales bacterium]|jgi:hypothetical protein|nr:hypothetical protein [Frankiales bacterium]
MRRKMFDALLTVTGLVLAGVLLIAGGLLAWGSHFVSTQVHDQLAAERIFVPPAGSDALNDPAIKPYLAQYAGQQVTTGKQAEAYADHFIAVHLKGISGGKTYSELSAQAQANPTDTALAAKVNTVFKGETLRGLLLNAYAFGTMARIAAIAAVVSFAAAALMLVLSGLGLLHLRRTPADAELAVPGWHPEAQTV